MKKTCLILLVLLLSLSLCACGQPQAAPAPESAPPQAEPEEAVPQDSSAVDGIPGDETPVLGGSETSAQDLFALAESFVDRPVSELIDAIGEPLDRAYVSSCLGDGEDGELYYDGFTVFTYREGDSEIVMGVE